MSNKIVISFRVRDRGGPQARRRIEGEVDAFDWEEFKKCPNAEAFAKKAYMAAVKKLLREIRGGSPSVTCDADISSLESVLARSLHYTQEELSEWWDSRDWNVVKLSDKTKKSLKGILLNPTARYSFYDEPTRTALWEAVSSLADTPTDAIADYLFSRITTAPEPIDLSEE